MNSLWSGIFNETGCAGYIIKLKIGYKWELYLENYDVDKPLTKGWALTFKKAMEKCHKSHDNIPAGFGIWRVEE